MTLKLDMQHLQLTVEREGTLPLGTLLVKPRMPLFAGSGAEGSCLLVATIQTLGASLGSIQAFRLQHLQARARAYKLKTGHHDQIRIQQSPGAGYMNHTVTSYAY